MIRLSEIAKQELAVTEAFIELERLSEVAEAKFEEWSLARTLEQKAFDAWLTEQRLLSRMKGMDNDETT